MIIRRVDVDLECLSPYTRRLVSTLGLEKKFPKRLVTSVIIVIFSNGFRVTFFLLDIQLQEPNADRDLRKTAFGTRLRH